MTKVIIGTAYGLACSGIEVSHPDFGGRAIWGIDLVQSRSARAYTDENGHGTHVTGKNI
jgi:subtilisin family serine protease